MNDKERDDMIRETHDAVIPLKLLVERHDRSLYDDEHGAMPRLQTVEQTQRDCPARKAHSNGHGRETFLGRYLDKIALAAAMILLTSIISIVAAFAGDKKLTEDEIKALKDEIKQAMTAQP